MTNRKFFNIKTMAKVSILAAIAFILMEFDFDSIYRSAVLQAGF